MEKNMSDSVLDRREFLKAGSAAAVLAGASALSVANNAAAALSGSGTKWAFLVDLRVCSGCQSCSVACKTQNNVVLGKFRSGVRAYDHGAYPAAKRSFVPWLCNHCDKPVCIANCPADKVKKPWGAEVAATYKRPDGIVVVDQNRCVGCGNCVDDCPYGVRYQDPETKAGGNPDEKAASKCDLCLAQVENGVVPACVNTCPGGARSIADLNNADDPATQAIRKNQGIVSTLLPQKGTQPQCFYIDPDRKVAETYQKSSDQFNKMNKKAV